MSDWHDEHFEEQFNPDDPSQAPQSEQEQTIARLETEIEQLKTDLLDCTEITCSCGDIWESLAAFTLHMRMVHDD